MCPGFTAVKQDGETYSLEHSNSRKSFEIFVCESFLAETSESRAALLDAAFYFVRHRCIV